LFNRPQPSKRAKAWRPEPGLLSQNSSRGFATTRWGGAEDGFMVDDIKRTKDGFALDEYAQVPLSPQAIAALKRLKAMEPDENVVIADEVFEAPEQFQIETWNANAHLPFVVDAYAFDDEDIGQNMAHVEAIEEAKDVAEVLDDQNVRLNADNAQVDASQAQNVQAEDDVHDVQDAALAVEASTADDIQTEPEASAAAETAIEVEAEANTEVKAEAAEAAQAKADAAVGLAIEAELAAEVEPELEPEKQTAAADETPDDISAEAEHAEASSETPSDESTTNKSTAEPSQALADDQAQENLQAQEETDMVESDVVDEEAVAPEQMAATVDEVVDDVTLPEPVLEGIDPEEVAQREAAKFAEGLAQGIEQGERQARDAMQQEVQAQCTVLANVTQELHALLKDSTAFYEPMKRLAMHLAEQIVKSELKTSTHAIEQLIQHCLNELDHPAQGLVVIELNPEDKARLQAQSPDLIQGMRLEAVQDMQPGSVRLFANDTVIEDLVEHRLEALAESMLVDVATWKAKSALAKPDVSAQDLESEDVHP
jgi:flagellar biosynthesis/type III secretory pathway protein FliH